MYVTIHVCPPSLQQRVVARCAAERPDLAAYDKNRKALYEALTGFGYTCPRANGAFYMLRPVTNFSMLVLTAFS